VDIACSFESFGTTTHPLCHEAEDGNRRYEKDEIIELPYTSTPDLRMLRRSSSLHSVNTRSLLPRS
jgi:hypothetical protein